MTGGVLQVGGGKEGGRGGKEEFKEMVGKSEELGHIWAWMLRMKKRCGYTLGWGFGTRRLRGKKKGETGMEETQKKKKKQKKTRRMGGRASCPRNDGKGGGIDH